MPKVSRKVHFFYFPAHLSVLCYNFCMCARVTLRCDVRKVMEEFGIRAVRATRDFRPSYNIPPGTDVLAVVQNGAKGLRPLRWGLIPSWAKDPAIGNKLINARAETLAEKPAFRGAFRERRCLVAVDGFYEWRRERGKSLPFFVRMRGDRIFGIAGLYETWRAPDGCDVATCTVITTGANSLLGPIHDRMPVIIVPDQREAWLHPRTEAKELVDMLVPYAPEEMEAYAVSTFVNSAAHDSPECIMPAGEK